MIPILAVAGRPILHSMSPIIFRELFRAAGREAAYTRVAASSAAEAIGLFASLGMRGMNLTSPFKEQAASSAGGLLAELTPDARELGAVNCLVASEGGSALGVNTDMLGVLGALEGRGVAIAGRRCLVIGAGGAGKAAALALVRAGGEVVVANRTLARAEGLAGALGCSAAGLDELAELASGVSVIVSTLAADALPDPSAWFPSRRDLDAAKGGPGSLAVLDADYKRGALSRFAAARGAVVAGGAEWLACQALPAYRLFMGEPPPPRPAAGELAAMLEAELGRRAAAPRSMNISTRPRIALIGLMGAGKTRTGALLARALGMSFVDSDAEIEAEAGLSVSAIFASEGESGFRAREARVLDRITSSPEPFVLATGGGAPTFPSSARLLSERCLCAWLHVAPETAAERTGSGAGGTRAGTRPLLAGGDGEQRLRRLEAERRGAYASLAELLVSTEGRSAAAVAEVIHDEIAKLS